VKVPNKVINTALRLAQIHNGQQVAPPSTDDVQALITWANEGINKRAAMASAPRSTNVAD
jgi:hypothetical protein